MWLFVAAEQLQGGPCRWLSSLWLLSSSGVPLSLLLAAGQLSGPCRWPVSCRGSPPLPAAAAGEMCVCGRSLPVAAEQIWGPSATTKGSWELRGRDQMLTAAEQLRGGPLPVAAAGELRGPRWSGVRSVAGGPTAAGGSPAEAGLLQGSPLY